MKKLKEQNEGFCYLRLNEFDANEVYLVSDEHKRAVSSALSKAQKYCNDEEHESSWEKSLYRAWEYSDYTEEYNKDRVKTENGKSYYISKNGVYEIKKSYHC